MVKLILLAKGGKRQVLKPRLNQIESKIDSTRIVVHLAPLDSTSAILIRRQSHLQFAHRHEVIGSTHEQALQWHANPAESIVAWPLVAK
jgi:hypothetical protein